MSADVGSHMVADKRHPLIRIESETSRRMAAKDTAHTSRNKETNTVYIYIFK